MIRKPTALIFGAGVSWEYGFPLGRTLLLQIATNLRESTPLKQSIIDCGFDPQRIEMFAKDLYASMQPSVDAFLELQKRYEDIGKAAIAASLIRAESPLNVTSRDKLKLYEYLWSRITGTLKTYSGNQLSIITFNYDRSFEEFLRRALIASHFELRDNPNELKQVLSHFSIVHVYGALGELESEQPHFLPYGGSSDPVDRNAISNAAGRLKLYHESTEDAALSNRVRDLIRNAEIICFLGFSFHPMNVRLLQFLGLGENKHATYFSSAFNIAEGERVPIREMLGFDIEFGGELSDSLQFVRDHPVLR